MYKSSAASNHKDRPVTHDEGTPTHEICDFSPDHTHRQPERSFRPIQHSEEQTTRPWPLHRNTRMRSWPSCDGVNASQDVYGKNTVAAMPLHRSLDLPSDFVPPRHRFGTPLHPHQTNDNESGHATSHMSRRASPTKVISASATIQARQEDILCGRGAPSEHHPGNEIFRYLIERYQSRYVFANRREKPVIAMRILDLLRSRGMRFLRRDRDCIRNGWVELSEHRAYEKVCIALRQGTASSNPRCKKVPTVISTRARVSVRTRTVTPPNYDIFLSAGKRELPAGFS